MSEMSPFLREYLDELTEAYVDPYQPNATSIAFAQSLGTLYNLEGVFASGKTHKAMELDKYPESYGFEENEFQLVRSSVTRSLRREERLKGTAYRHPNVATSPLARQRFRRNLSSGSNVQASRHETGHLYTIERDACRSGAKNLITLTNKGIKEVRDTGVFLDIQRIVIIPGSSRLWDKHALKRDGGEMTPTDKLIRVQEGLSSLEDIEEVLDASDEFPKHEIIFVHNFYDGKPRRDAAAATIAKAIRGELNKTESEAAYADVVPLRNHFLNLQEDLTKELAA